MHYNVQCRSVTYQKYQETYITWYKERASSSIVHVYAYMWFSVSVEPSRGQCCLLHDTRTSGTFTQTPSLSVFSMLYYIFHYSLIQGGFYRESDLLRSSGASHYRLQTLFFFYIEDLMGWAGNLRERDNRRVIAGWQHFHTLNKWTIINIVPVNS